MASFKDLFEGSADFRKVVSAELNKLGVDHTWEPAGKHDAAVYNAGGRTHKFHVSRCKKGDGKMRQEIVSSVRRHVRAANGAGPDIKNRSN
jgi:hypothetical protein